MGIIYLMLIFENSQMGKLWDNINQCSCSNSSQLICLNCCSKIQFLKKSVQKKMRREGWCVYRTLRRFVYINRKNKDNSMEHNGRLSGEIYRTPGMLITAEKICYVTTQYAICCLKLPIDIASWGISNSYSKIHLYLIWVKFYISSIKSTDKSRTINVAPLFYSIPLVKQACLEWRYHNSSYDFG